MTEEPYRWLEAIGNRREYVREQLKGGSPVLAASLPDGILLLGVGSGNTKVFELHDRLAMAALGHPADLERIRQAAIDAAHLEAFTRAPEDVSLRRLVGFGLSAQIKLQFEQLFTAPVLGEFVFVELGAERESDLLFRLHFDGTFSAVPGGCALVAFPAEAEGRIREWLGAELRKATPRAAAARLLLEAWWLLSSGSGESSDVPSAADREAGWRDAVAGKVVEIGWLRRRGGRTARYETLSLDAVLAESEAPNAARS
ncbi:MAG: proteasome subunit alpha [Verrucomicrobiota bacterium]